MLKSSLFTVVFLVVFASFLSSCSSLKKIGNTTKTEISKIELPPNVSSNKLSKKRLKN